MSGGALAKSVLLVACGCFNPVTNMHLRLFELARDALEKTNRFKVVSGIISPTNDGYGKAGLLASQHRVKMCQFAVKSSDWIRVSSWEAEQPAWTETRKVLTHIQQETTTSFSQHGNVSVKLLCGADLLESFNVPGLWKNEDIEAIVKDFGIVVITRAGSHPEQFIETHPVLHENKGNILVVEEWIPNEISATKIRNALNRGESIKYLVPDAVVDYIHSNNLYKS